MPRNEAHLSRKYLRERCASFLGTSYKRILWPFQANLDSQGLFLPAEQLRGQFQQLIGGIKPEHVVHQCGSGVTACHNLLAMEVAGLSGSKLYPGSWSEWIRDKNRPVAVD